MRQYEIADDHVSFLVREQRFHDNHFPVSRFKSEHRLPAHHRLRRTLNFRKVHANKGLLEKSVRHDDRVFIDDEYLRVRNATQDQKETGHNKYNTAATKHPIKRGGALHIEVNNQIDDQTAVVVHRLIRQCPRTGRKKYDGKNRRLELRIVWKFSW